MPSDARIQDQIRRRAAGWAGEPTIGTCAVVPQGLDDATLLVDAGNRVHAQVKSRRESAGNYSKDDLARLCRAVAGDHVLAAGPGGHFRVYATLNPTALVNGRGKEGGPSLDRDRRPRIPDAGA